MKDLAMSLQNNKFLIENDRWRFTRSRLEQVSQKVRHAISIFYDEWFFNPGIGIPYIPGEDEDSITHRRIIENRLQTTITGIDGVSKLLSFNTTVDKATRTLSVAFVAQIDTGETFEETRVLGA
jgi:hypothetical protein